MGAHVLGAPLALPSLDVWWLGEPTAYAFVMAHLDAMIVRPCLGPDREPIVVGMLEAAQRRSKIIFPAIRSRLDPSTTGSRSSRQARAPSSKTREKIVPARGTRRV